MYKPQGKLLGTLGALVIVFSLTCLLYTGDAYAGPDFDNPVELPRHEEPLRDTIINSEVGVSSFDGEYQMQTYNDDFYSGAIGMSDSDVKGILGNQGYGDEVYLDTWDVLRDEGNSQWDATQGLADAIDYGAIPSPDDLRYNEDAVDLSGEYVEYETFEELEPIDEGYPGLGGFSQQMTSEYVEVEPLYESIEYLEPVDNSPNALIYMEETYGVELDDGRYIEFGDGAEDQRAEEYYRNEYFNEDAVDLSGRDLWLDEDAVDLSGKDIWLDNALKDN